MADEIAKIGLDTADMSRALDRISGQLEKQLGKSADKADKEVNKLSKSMRAMGNAARAALGLAGLGGFSAAARSIKELNSDIEETRSHLVRGSKEAKAFDKTISESGGQDSLDKVKNVADRWDRTIIRTKLQLANLTDKVFGKSGGSSAAGGKSSEVSNIQNVQAAEGRLSDLRAKASHTIQHQLNLNEKEVELEKEKLKYYSEGAGRDEIKLRTARERLGMLEYEAKVLKQAFRDSERIAEVDIALIESKRTGAEKALEIKKLELEYDQKIHQELLKHGTESQGLLLLETQKTRAIKEAMAAQKNETPAERREKRRNERKLNSDSNKQAARDRELDNAILRGAKGAPGSRLEERRNRNILHNKQLGAQPKQLSEFDRMLNVMKGIETNTKGSVVIQQK